LDPTNHDPIFKLDHDPIYQEGPMWTIILDHMFHLKTILWFTLILLNK